MFFSEASCAAELVCFAIASIATREDVLRIVLRATGIAVVDGVCQGDLGRRVRLCWLVMEC